MLQEYKELLASTASVCTILQFLSPMLIMRKYIKNGTVGDTSAFPYVAAFLSCSLWLRYGFLLDDTSLKVVNTTGAFLQFAYINIYCLYSTRKTAVMRQFLGILLVLLTVIAYMQYETELASAKQHLGLICCCVTIVFFAAPFTMLAHVIKVKSAESLPFSLIFANLVVSALWLMYGAVLEDPYIVVTNGLGCMLSSVQLLLFVCYPSTPQKRGLIQVR